MALRQIRTLGDPVLEKKCKEVKEMTPRLRELIEDMFETMYDAEGVGLAAPQVGVLRQIVVIDVGDAGEDGEDQEQQESPEQAEDMEDQEELREPVRDPIVLINPRIVEQDGEQTGQEGCLSVPGKAGTVTRPEHVKVAALDENMQEFELEAEGLLARAVCHELDHLEGIMYVTKVEGELYEVSPDIIDSEEAGRSANPGTGQQA